MLNKAHLWNKDQLLFLITFSIVFASRIPFLLPGYGTDPDAWGVVFASRQIWNTGSYHISRFPGNPIPEFFYSLIWWGGPVLLNGTTALLSSLASAFIATIVKKLDGQEPFLSAMIFAFIPVIYINSVNSIDYVWAIAFILGSLNFLLGNRLLLSGFFLGLAIGCRITSGAMLIPLAILWFVKNKQENRKELVQFMLGTLVIASLCFLPGFIKYGFSLFKFTEFSNIPLLIVIKLITVDVWGYLGIIVLAISLCYLLVRLSQPNLNKNKKKKYYWVWLSIILVYIASFLRLPHEAGYLIPVLPFMIFILNCFMSRKAYLLFGVGIMLSPFFLGMSLNTNNVQNRTSDFSLEINISESQSVTIYPFSGPIFRDHALRKSRIERFENIFNFGNNLHQKSLIIVGWHISEFAVLGLDKNHNSQIIQYSDLLSLNEIQHHFSRGYKIYYLPEMVEPSKQIYGVDFQKFEGIPLNEATIQSTEWK